MFNLSVLTEGLSETCNLEIINVEYDKKVSFHMPLKWAEMNLKKRILQRFSCFITVTYYCEECTLSFHSKWSWHQYDWDKKSIALASCVYW